MDSILFLEVYLTALMIKCRDRKENDQVTERKVLTEERVTDLNIERLVRFLLSPSVTLVHLTLSKLAVVGVLEDKIDFNELKNRQHSYFLFLNH